MMQWKRHSDAQATVHVCKRGITYWYNFFQENIAFESWKKDFDLSLDTMVCNLKKHHLSLKKNPLECSLNGVSIYICLFIEWMSEESIYIVNFEQYLLHSRQNILLKKHSNCLFFV